jgi:hypothetical protein
MEASVEDDNFFGLKLTIVRALSLRRDEFRYHIIYFIEK